MYGKARDIFQKIKDRGAARGDVTLELERALDALVNKYNTSDQENRFVVGGASEILLCAWLRAIGISARRLSKWRTDLEIEGVAFSVKTNFARSSTIRLVNVLGESQASRWEEPTLILLGGEGLFYIDPELCLDVSSGAVKREKDAWVLKSRAVRALSDKWCFSLKVPVKPANKMVVSTASQDVARAVLIAVGSKSLLSHLP